MMDQMFGFILNEDNEKEVDLFTEDSVSSQKTKHVVVSRALNPNKKKRNREEAKKKKKKKRT